MMLVPRQTTPDLNVATLSHGDFSLAAETAGHGTLVCFYRGLHCPLCATYLTELEKLTPAFAERGVATIAVSADARERAQQMAEKIPAHALRLGYALALGTARQWGLYISAARGKTSIGIEEPALFSEPGLFLVLADRTLYYASVQTMPFVRPHFKDLLAALDFIIKKRYPARGEYAGAV